MKQVNMKKDYREKLTSFRISCRIYYKEKDEMHRIEMEHPSFKQDVQQDSVFCIGLEENSGKGDLELYQFLKEDVTYVDDMFKKIRKVCGVNASVFLWTLFVESETQEAVAHIYGLSRRQVQYAMNKWMHMVLDDDAE